MVDPFLLEGTQIRSAGNLKMNPIFRSIVEAGLISRIARGTAAALLLGFASTGCHSTAPVKQSGDPILGEIHPQNNKFGPTPPASASTGTGGSPGAYAPRPTNNAVTVSPTSPAYLASINRTLPDSSPLAIGDRPFGRATLPTVIAVPRDPAVATLASNANNPLPGWNLSTSAPIVQTSAIPSGFVDPNEALLKSRGIMSQKQEPVPGGGIRLTAIAPNPSNPGAFRTFEVQARDYPAAVQAILQQMDGKR